MDGSGPRPDFVPSPWISRAEFTALRRHPELPAAVASHATSLIGRYRGNALLNALLCDRGRLILGLFILYLDGHPAGATLSAVQALCDQTRLCSAGRAASVVAAMGFGGYVVRQSDPRDRRRRVLVPTPKLIDAYRQNWIDQFEAMTPIFAGAGQISIRLHEPAFLKRFLQELGRYFLADFRILDHVPVLKPLLERNAGLLLLSFLAVPHLAASAPPGEPVPVSISSLARRFCVSRGHVRNVMAAAAQAGLLDYDVGSSQVSVRPALQETILHFFAVLFLWFDRAGAGASAWPDPSGPT